MTEATTGCVHCLGISNNEIGEIISFCEIWDNGRNVTLGDCFGNCEDQEVNMAATESQRAKILDWMLEGHRITGLEALHRFRCMRLGARILEIKKEHWPVEDRFITVEDPDTGKPKRVKEYWLNLPFYGG